MFAVAIVDRASRTEMVRFTYDSKDAALNGRIALHAAVNPNGVKKGSKATWQGRPVLVTGLMTAE